MMRIKDADLSSRVDEQKVCAEVDAEAKAAPNFVVEYFFLTGRGPWRSRRDRLAQLRLIRTAVQYRITGRVLELDDPFGAKLQHSRAIGTLRIWSVGKNGTDDGSQGDWKGGHPDDIVLEIDRWLSRDMTRPQSPSSGVSLLAITALSVIAVVVFLFVPLAPCPAIGKKMMTLLSEKFSSDTLNSARLHMLLGCAECNGTGRVTLLLRCTRRPDKPFSSNPSR